MKRTILAVIIAMSSVSAFANQGDAHQAAVSNSVHQSGGFHSAGSTQNGAVDSARNAARNAAMSARDAKAATKAANDAKAAHDAQQAANQAKSAADAQQAANQAKSDADKAQAAKQARDALDGQMARDGMAALTQSKMASASNPVGAAPSQPAGPTATVGEALDGKQTNSSMNVSASSLNPNMDVKTDAGVVKAGSLPADAQVKVGMDSVFAGAPAKKGGHESNHSSHSEHGTGNGGNNAANSNSAHGLGGGNHIGGGSAQSGSRNVGHW
ncbi:hypothetical protein KS527_004588 [Salmonella enterica]|nr:hypothetical protein [Salmonella enterica]